MGSKLKQHIQEPGAREIQLYNVENRHGNRYGKSIYQSEVSILVMWFILTNQKRPIDMLGGSSWVTHFRRNVWNVYPPIGALYFNLVTWYILTHQKRLLDMPAGPLQVPGYYNVSRVENWPIRRLYFPFYVHIWYTGSSGPEPPI